MGYPSVFGWEYVLPLWQLIKHPAARQRLAGQLVYGCQPLVMQLINMRDKGGCLEGPGRCRLASVRAFMLFQLTAASALLILG